MSGTLTMMDETFLLAFKLGKQEGGRAARRRRGVVENEEREVTAAKNKETRNFFVP